MLRPQCASSVRMQPLSRLQQPHNRGYLLRRLSISRAPSASWVPYTRQNQEVRDLLAKRAAAYERRITEDKFPPMPPEVETLVNNQPQSSDPAVAPSTASPPTDDSSSRSSGGSGTSRLSVGWLLSSPSKPYCVRIAQIHTIFHSKGCQWLLVLDRRGPSPCAGYMHGYLGISVMGHGDELYEDIH